MAARKIPALGLGILGFGGRNEMVDRGRVELPTPGFSVPGSAPCGGHLLGTGLAKAISRLFSTSVESRLCRRHGPGVLGGGAWRVRTDAVGVPYGILPCQRADPLNR
jgi:hypothetical protein